MMKTPDNEMGALALIWRVLLRLDFKRDPFTIDVWSVASNTWLDEQRSPGPAFGCARPILIRFGHGTGADRA
jgi:hypothetical protein